MADFDALKAWVDLYDWLAEESDRIMDREDLDPHIRESARISYMKVNDEMDRLMHSVRINDVVDQLKARDSVNG